MLEKGTWFNGSWSLLYADLCTQNNDGIRKCSFMVPEYFFFVIKLFKKADRFVCPSVGCFCLFISVDDNLTEPIKKKIS